MNRGSFYAFLLAGCVGMFQMAPALGAEVASPPDSAAPQVDKALLAADVAFWTSIQASQKPEELQLYLQKFPNGMFADLARQRLTPADPSVPVDAATIQQAPVVTTAPTVVAVTPVEPQVVLRRKPAPRIVRVSQPPVVVIRQPPRFRVTRVAPAYIPPRKRVRVVRRQFVPDAPIYSEAPAPVYQPPAAANFGYDGGGGGGRSRGGGGGGGGGWGK